MAIKSWRRKELSQPDEFVSLSFRAWELVRSHAAPIAVGIAATGIVLIAGGVWKNFSGKRDVEATKDLTEALEISAQPLLGEGESPANESAPENAPDSAANDAAAADKPRFRTAKERAAEVIKAIDETQQKSPKVGRAALLVRASALMDLERVDEAVSKYRLFLDEAAQSDPLRVIAYEGLGYALEKKGDLEKARIEFRAMAPAEDSPLRDRALWHEGRLLQKLGKKEDARRAFQMILDKFASSPLRDDVQARLAALDG